jgi:uncharacterized membrane protein
MGSMPDPRQDGASEWEPVTRAGRLMELAGDNFTKGLRTYYFAIPVLCWFVHPWLFIAGSLSVAVTIYWMDFHSKTLVAMRGDNGKRG